MIEKSISKSVCSFKKVIMTFKPGGIRALCFIKGMNYCAEDIHDTKTFNFEKDKWPNYLIIDSDPRVLNQIKVGV